MTIKGATAGCLPTVGGMLILLRSGVEFFIYFFT